MIPDSVLSSIRNLCDYFKDDAYNDWLVEEKPIRHVYVDVVRVLDWLEDGQDE